MFIRHHAARGNADRRRETFCAMSRSKSYDPENARLSRLKDIVRDVENNGIRLPLSIPAMVKTPLWHDSSILKSDTNLCHYVRIKTFDDLVCILTAEAWVQSQGSPYRIHGGQSSFRRHRHVSVPSICDVKTSEPGSRPQLTSLWSKIFARIQSMSKFGQDT
jgi:hypothetical protein